MSKAEFLNSLEKLLKSLGKEERKRYLVFYDEMFEDYMEDGCTEEQAADRIGMPGAIAQEILSERGTKIAAPMSRGMKILIAVLLVLGSPLWGSLLLAGLALALAGMLLVICGYILIWLIPIVLAGFSITGLIMFVMSIAGSSVLAFQNMQLGIAQFGIGILSAGIFAAGGILTWLLGKYFIKVTASFTAWLLKPIQKRREKKHES